MSRKNMIGYALPEKFDPLFDGSNYINNYDKTVTIRQKELEDKINQLIVDFQRDEKVVVLVDFNSDNFRTNPIEIRLIIDLAQQRP